LGKPKRMGGVGVGMREGEKGVCIGPPKEWGRREGRGKTWGIKGKKSQGTQMVKGSGCRWGERENKNSSFNVIGSTKGKTNAKKMEEKKGKVVGGVRS